MDVKRSKAKFGIVDVEVIPKDNNINFLIDHFDDSRKVVDDSRVLVVPYRFSEKFDILC